MSRWFLLGGATHAAVVRSRGCSSMMRPPCTVPCQESTAALLPPAAPAPATAPCRARSSPLPPLPSPPLACGSAHVRGDEGRARPLVFGLGLVPCSAAPASRRTCALHPRSFSPPVCAPPSPCLTAATSRLCTYRGEGAAAAAAVVADAAVSVADLRAAYQTGPAARPAALGITGPPSFCS